MAEESAGRGLVDTSVVIELEFVAPGQLPAQIAIAAVTLAELAAGPHATADPAGRARRQERLQRAEATFQAIPFDADAARAYGHVYAHVAYSDPSDFDGLDALLDVIAVQRSHPRS